MQPRRGTALLLTCVLGLLLVTPVHAAAQPRHPVRHVALLAPAGLETPHPWRSGSGDAVLAGAHRPVTMSAWIGAAATGRPLAAHRTRITQDRGPPGSALV